MEKQETSLSEKLRECAAIYHRGSKTGEALLLAASALEEPKIRAGLNYSCFVLEEDGTWEQPTYLVDYDMTEAEFSARVLIDSGRHDFLVVGVQEDPDCPDENLRRFS